MNKTSTPEKVEKEKNPFQVTEAIPEQKGENDSFKSDEEEEAPKETIEPKK